MNEHTHYVVYAEWTDDEGEVSQAAFVYHQHESDRAYAHWERLYTAPSTTMAVLTVARPVADNPEE